MIIEKDLLSVATQISALVRAMAEVGHHEESQTAEFYLIQAHAQSIANRYADDLQNRRHFMAQAGLSVSDKTQRFESRFTSMPVAGEHVAGFTVDRKNGQITNFSGTYAGVEISDWPEAKGALMHVFSTGILGETEQPNGFAIPVSHFQI